MKWRHHLAFFTHLTEPLLTSGCSRILKMFFQGLNTKMNQEMW